MTLWPLVFPKPNKRFGMGAVIHLSIRQITYVQAKCKEKWTLKWDKRHNPKILPKCQIPNSLPVLTTKMTLFSSFPSPVLFSSSREYSLLQILYLSCFWATLQHSMLKLSVTTFQPAEHDSWICLPPYHIKSLLSDQGLLLCRHLTVCPTLQFGSKVANYI